MVYLIQIAEGTYRPGVNNIGDVHRVGENQTTLEIAKAQVVAEK